MRFSLVGTTMRLSIDIVTHLASVSRKIQSAQKVLPDGGVNIDYKQGVSIGW